MSVHPSSGRQASTARLPDDVTLTENVACEARDGAVLASDIYRPDLAADQRLPVLLMRTPYDKAAAQANETFPAPAWFARRGYIVVVQDVRGRFASEGRFDPIGNEVPDGYDAVEWCAQLPGCDGSVGMYGASYAGMTQFAAAAQRPPALVCISPAVACLSFKDNWLPGGLPRLLSLTVWLAEAARTEALRRGEIDDAVALTAFVENPTAPFMHPRAPEPAVLQIAARYLPFLADWIATPTDDSDFWDPYRLTTPTVPTLYIGGWFDAFIGEMHDLFADHSARCGSARMLVGAWGHVPFGQPLLLGGEPSSAAGRPIFTDSLLEWFDWQLMGREPTSWMRDHRACWCDLTDGSWRPGEPGEAIPATIYSIRSDGRATVELTGRLIRAGMEPNAAPVGTDLLVDDPFVPVTSPGGWSATWPELGASGPADQSTSASSTSVAVYTSDPLEDASTLTGRSEVELTVTTEHLPFTLFATLCVIRGGATLNVARGLWRAEAAGEDDRRWQAHRAQILLTPTLVTLRQGERLRLLIHASCYPEVAADPHVPGSVLSIGTERIRISRAIVAASGGSTVRLPITSPGTPAEDS